MGIGFSRLVNERLLPLGDMLRVYMMGTIKLGDMF
jgi:hypothetical protein